MSSGRPYRVCGVGRDAWHGLVAWTLPELRRKGCAKLALDAAPDEVEVVLEEDGTIVDEDEYLQLLDKNSGLMLLRPGQRWDRPRAQEVETDGRPLSESELVARMLHRDLSLITNLSDSQLRVVAEEEPERLAAWLGGEREAELVWAACGRLLDERQQLRDVHEFLKLYRRAEEHDRKGRSREAAADVADGCLQTSRDPGHVEPGPSDSATFDPGTVDLDSSDASPVDPSPSHSAPPDPGPSDSSTSDPGPSHSAPPDPIPSDSSTSDSDSSDSSTSDPGPMTPGPSDLLTSDLRPSDLRPYDEDRCDMIPLAEQVERRRLTGSVLLKVNKHGIDRSVVKFITKELEHVLKMSSIALAGVLCVDYRDARGIQRACLVERNSRWQQQHGLSHAIETDQFHIHDFSLKPPSVHSAPLLARHKTPARRREIALSQVASRRRKVYLAAPASHAGTRAMFTCTPASLTADDEPTMKKAKPSDTEDSPESTDE